MDFSEILKAWENRGHRRDQEPYLKDEPPEEPRATPTREVMERTTADDELDLHGMLQDEALTSLKFFLRDAQREGCRKVLVIHGKGLHSENRRAVLKDAVRQALMKDSHVAAWGEASRKEGGQGASWVWLNALGK